MGKKNKSKYSVIEQIELSIANLEKENAQLTGLILSGHDGGGQFYGDDSEDGISKEELFKLANMYPAQMKSMNTALLMGCWSAVPKEVDEWKTAFPGLKMVGGFVGSAPSVDRIAGAQFISDILKNAKKIMQTNESSVANTIIKSIRNLKIITAGIYVDLSKAKCSEVVNNKNQYYYVSPSNFESELGGKNGSAKTGFNPYVPTISSQAQLLCKQFSNQFNWDILRDYFSGKKEPQNNDELRRNYSALRNNEHCFSNKFIPVVYSADQTMFLRFFQDVKKNFAKYFATDIQDSTVELSELLRKPHSPSLDKYLAHPLTPQSLVSMNRMQTLNAISELGKVLWNTDAPLYQLRKLMSGRV